MWSQKSKKKNIFLSFTLFLVCGFLFSFQLPKTNAAYTSEGTAFYAQTNTSSYASEGIAFFAYSSQIEGTIPVYRFYSSERGDHMYTASETEKDALNTEGSGYSYEGIAFYAYSSQAEGTTPVYRFYNSTTNDHIYTASDGERTTLAGASAYGYSYEGKSFYIFASQEEDTVPVYRFYNSSTGDHFYTASENEKNQIVTVPVFRFWGSTNGDHMYTASSSEKGLLENTTASGYLYEGIAFYAYSSQVTNSVPVYRFYNSEFRDHMYTASETEKDTLSTEGSGYSYEGIAFYAYSSQISGSSPVYRFYDSQIGDHFYTASESEKNAITLSSLGPEISVGLWNYGSKSALKNDPFKITANKTYNIKNKDGKIVGQIAGDTETRVTYDADSYLKAYGSISSTKSKKIFYFDAADGDNSTLIFNVHRPSSDYDEYRGKIKIQYSNTSNLWVINTLPLEHYVWGDGELTGTGDEEHTKTMVTIFRTYGYWYIKYATAYSSYGFKIRGDSGSQIYSGYEHEESYPNIKNAAEDTQGVIATYDDDVALTPYSSWSAGETRSFEDYWGSDDYPWCKSVDDPYGDYNNDYWEHSATKTEAQLTNEGNHMVGLIAHGSLYLAEENDWTYIRILKYYFTGIDLDAIY